MKRWTYVVVVWVVSGLAPAAFIYDCSSIDIPTWDGTAKDMNGPFTEWTPAAFPLIHCETFSTPSGCCFSIGNENRTVTPFDTAGAYPCEGFGLYDTRLEIAAFLPQSILFEEWDPTDLLAASSKYSQKLILHNDLLWGAMLPVY